MISTKKRKKPYPLSSDWFLIGLNFSVIDYRGNRVLELQAVYSGVWSWASVTNCL